MKKTASKKSRLERIPFAVQKGVFLLPSILTLANILFGFSAIMVIMKFKDNPQSTDLLFTAAIFILIAGVFDAIDGRVARLTNSTSSFGVQLDSIADVISFGIAPGLLVFCWALEGFDHHQRSKKCCSRGNR